jgi:hypothetical protein
VIVPLSDEAAGTLRLAVYEYRSSPPKLIAERLVFRRPSGRLDVRAVVQERTYRPGESVEVPFQVTDEQGKPVPAALSIAVVDESRCPRVATAWASAASQFLFLGEIENSQGIENADFYLSGDRKAAVALDLLLATRAGRQAGVASEPARRQIGQAVPSPAAAAAYAACEPPLMLDNLSDLLGRFQDSLASYRANRTRVLNALTTLSFFGGIGLVVFVAMLSLLNIPCGLRLWGPSLGVAAACIVVGAVLMDPERLKPNQEGTVPFTTHETPPTARESDGKRGGTKRIEPFADITTDAKHSPGPGTILWRPLVSTDHQGRASVRVQLPTRPATYRILVDAHANGGRIGGSSAAISCEMPSRPEPPKSAATSEKTR